MWDLKADYGRKGLDSRCPMCQSEEDTTEQVLGYKETINSISMMREGMNGER